MSRFWVVLAVLILVNLITSAFVKADSALKDVEISTGKNPKRKLNIPGTITRRYSWSFEIPGYANSDYTVLMAIDSEQHNTISNYNMESRHGWSNFRSMVQESTKALWRLVDEFRKVIPPRWSEERKVNFVLAFVQSLPYTEDVTTGYNEFYKYAIETLFDGGGDCEDTSILFAAILNGLGFEVALIIPPGHLAVGVKGDFRGAVVSYKNNNYYYCETTGTGWKLGQVPDDYKGKKVEIMPITPARLPPKQVNPWSKPPVPPRPNPSPIRLSKGINQFETAVSYEKAIESFKYVLNQNGLSSKQRVLAHLYWGCSELGLTNRTEPNYNYYVRKAKEQFSKVFRYNPDQELPARLYSKKKIRTLFEEVRKESIGELTVIAPPQTDIWIDGNEINRKIGTGTISIKLFKGNYTVKGIYKGESIEKIVTIEPNSHKTSVLEIPVVDNIPPTITLRKPYTDDTFKVREDITIEAKVTDDTSVEKVFVHFSPTDKRPLSKKGYSDRYTINIWLSKPGFILYYLTATDGAGNERRYPKTGTLRITVTTDDNLSPTITLRKPYTDDTFKVREDITIEVKVTDDTSVEKVYVHFSTKSYELSKEGSSDIYTKVVWGTEAGILRYYLTATDEAGNERRYPKTGTLRITVTEEPDDETPPIIGLIKPNDSATFKVNQRITITAKITDDTSVKEVYVHFPSKSYELSKEGSSDIYTKIIWGTGAGALRYYLTATDEAGNERRYPKIGKLKIILIEEPGDVTPPIIHLITPYDGVAFKVNQRITITAEVTDDTSVKEVSFYYGVSQSNSLGPSKYHPKILTKTSLGIYTGYIPPEGKTGYICYYLTATDKAGNKCKSEVRWLKIAPIIDPVDRRSQQPLHREIWVAWSTAVFKERVPVFDLDRGGVFSLAGLYERKGRWMFGAQLDLSYQDIAVPYRSSWAGQLGVPLGRSPIMVSIVGGVAEYGRSDSATPILGASLKGYLGNRVTIDTTGSIYFRSIHGTLNNEESIEVGIRFYNIYDALFLRLGSKLYLGNRNLTTMQIGLGYSF